MDALGQLQRFYEVISDDHRIGATHISLYMAFFRVWVDNGCINPVIVVRVDVMRDAKIGSRDTYSRYLRDLNQYGYLRYEPSFNASVPSVVSILALR